MIPNLTSNYFSNGLVKNHQPVIKPWYLLLQPSQLIRPVPMGLRSDGYVSFSSSFAYGWRPSPYAAVSSGGQELWMGYLNWIYWVVATQTFFSFWPDPWGKWSNLTSIFVQMGWNHQLDDHFFLAQIFWVWRLLQKRVGKNDRPRLMGVGSHRSFPGGIFWRKDIQIEISRFSSKVETKVSQS